MMTLKSDILKQLAKGDNILITGGRNSGKTTLINKICTELPPHYLIVSKKEGNSVNLYWQGKVSQIGYFKQNNQFVKTEGFKLAVEALQFYLKSSCDLVVIDEIGFIERDERAYLDLIVQCANQRQLLAIVRKPNHALVERLDDITKYQLYDLDDDTHQ